MSRMYNPIHLGEAIMYKSLAQAQQERRPPGVLRVSYTLNCGACGMTVNHMPDPSIKTWDDLINSLSKGMWNWKLTEELGWVCGCQEIRKRMEAEIRAKASHLASLRQGGDLAF